MKQEIAAGGIVYKKLKAQMSNVKSHIEWLICQHSQHKGWVFPKGLIGDNRKGEAMEEAAIREVREEGGVTAQIIVPLPNNAEYVYKLEGQIIKKTVHYYLMEYLSGNPKDHDWEMMDAKFVSEADVRNTLTYKTDKKAFEEALKLLGD